jgi:rare lipoprotein A
LEHPAKARVHVTEDVQMLNTHDTFRSSKLRLMIAVMAFAVAAASSAQAKTPGKTYCENEVCHRVLTLAETEALIGIAVWQLASFYDDCKRDKGNPCTALSSGEKFLPGDADNAASPIYPNGTTISVFNPATQRSAILRINNSGPYHLHRKLDVSKGAAEALGFIDAGVANLRVTVIGAPRAE